MQRKCVFLFIGLLAVLVFPVRAEEFRTWTSSNGKFTVEAKLSDFDGNAVVLETKNGETIELTRDKLCEDDGKYLVAWNVRKKKEKEDGENPFETGASGSSRTSGSTSSARTSSSRTGSGRTASTAQSPASQSSKDGKLRQFNVDLDTADVIPLTAPADDWSVEPDPTPHSDPGFKPKAVAFNVGKLEFAVHPHETDYFFASDTPEKVLTVIHLSKSLNYSSIVFLGDTRTGKVQSFEYPFKLTPLALSPSGRLGLFTQQPAEQRGFPRLRQIVVLNVEDPKMPCLAVIQPFWGDIRNENDSSGDVKWASWLDETRILAFSSQGHLILFNFETGDAIWSISTDSYASSSPILSPGKKYLAIRDRKHSQAYFLVETETGEPLGRLTVTDGDALTFGNAAFSPDGTRFAQGTGSSVAVWNLTDCQKTDPYYIGSGKGGFGRVLEWMDGKLLLSDGLLVDTDQRIPVWAYHGLDGKDQAFAGYFWHAGREQNRFLLLPLKIPHPGFRIPQKETDEQKYCIRPGIQVKLHVDNAIPDSEKVREHLKNLVEKNGLEINDEAAITLTAKIQTEDPVEATYTTDRFPSLIRSSGGTKVNVTLYKMSVVFEELPPPEDEKTPVAERKPNILWSREMKTSPPDVSVDDIANESLQSVVARKSKPQSDWYLGTKIPEKIPFTDFGTLTVTASGMR